MECLPRAFHLAPIPANFKLATAGRMDAERLWYLDLRAGQAAAAIKAEARGLSYEFDVIHPRHSVGKATMANKPDPRKEI